MNKYNEFYKIEKIIRSCKNHDQLKIARNIIELFIRRYPEERHNLGWYLRDTDDQIFDEIIESIIILKEEVQGDQYEEHF